jgi:hypothetical protein
MRHVVLASSLFAAACGGHSSHEATTPSSSRVPFAELDLDHQIEFMKTTVVPAMKPIFQQHDAHKFADFGCATCHGPDANAGDFEMPNDKLPKLDFSDLSQFQTADLDWMQRQVKPTMARLLDLREADDPKQGLACLTCHTPTSGAQR